MRYLVRCRYTYHTGKHSFKLKGHQGYTKYLSRLSWIHLTHTRYRPNDIRYLNWDVINDHNRHQGYTKILITGILDAPSLHRIYTECCKTLEQVVIEILLMTLIITLGMPYLYLFYLRCTLLIPNTNEML